MIRVCPNLICPQHRPENNSRNQKRLTAMTGIVDIKKVCEKDNIPSHYWYINAYSFRVPRQELTPTKVRGSRRKELPGFTCQNCERVSQSVGLDMHWITLTLDYMLSFLPLYSITKQRDCLKGMRMSAQGTGAPSGNPHHQVNYLISLTLSEMLNNRVILYQPTSVPYFEELEFGVKDYLMSTPGSLPLADLVKMMRSYLLHNSVEFI